MGLDLKFEAKIVDGVGNPFHYLNALALRCSTSSGCAQQANVYKDVSPLRSVQERYWSEGIINGTIPIAYTARPGIYNLTLQAGGNYDGYSSAITKIPFEIIANPVKPRPYALFKPFTVNFTKDFFTNQTYLSRDIRLTTVVVR
jgi:hypothetical protein